MLPQAPDNEANGHLGLACKVKIFLKNNFSKTIQMHMGYSRHISTASPWSLADEHLELVK